MKYHLRQANDSDKHFLYSLHCATMRDAIEKTWGWDEVWQRNDFEKRFEECRVSIIEVEGRDVGGLWLRSSPDLIYIVDFQVLPERQGRGIGTSVLQELLTKASANDIPVELVVLQVNPRAQILYERNGFTVIEEGNPFIRMKYHFLSDPNDKMRKRTSPFFDSRRALHFRYSTQLPNQCPIPKK